MGKETRTNRIKIGITDTARYTNYERWILDTHTNVDVIRLSYRLNNLNDIEQCKGIVLTGGEDIDPHFYKRPELLEKLDPTDVDRQRDDFEWEVVKQAFQLKLPILGICRGMQLINVYLGGTLFYDIPTTMNIQGHASVQGIDQRHDIHVVEKSLLHEIAGCVKGAVNSSHHQCVDILGKGLIVAATAESPIIEAMQFQNTDENPFYLGVQWHPERMVDQDSPFSSGIRQAFLNSIINQENILNGFDLTQEDQSLECD